MRKKFQIILTLTLVIIFQIAFWSLAFLSKKYIHDEVVEQVKTDNKIIGEQIIRLLRKSYLSVEDTKTDKTLQHLCDSVKLPNGGFICAIDIRGNMVAAPGLKQGMTVPFGATLQHFDDIKRFETTDLDVDKVFDGYAHFEKDGRTDLVSSLPLNNEMRLFVHQNNEFIEKRAAKYVKPILLFGMIITVIVGLFTYLTADRIVNQYESKIEIQNNELKNALEEIRLQKQEIEIKNTELEKQKKEITDSIQYAKRIQQAALPSKKLGKDIIEEHFILFMPRDIVSGDFYWYHELENHVVITAVDCTGHGVPGAFMSMLGLTFLNEIVVEKGICDAGEVLNQMREKIVHALGQREEDRTTSDGMDMALCIIEKGTKKMQFAGAFSQVICVRDDKVIELKGDRMPVGIYGRMETGFNTHELQLQSKDMLYLFSDGYADQFGGKNGRKFLIKNFRQLLLEIRTLSLGQQKDVLQMTLQKWQGNRAQIDDILVIGVKIK